MLNRLFDELRCLLTAVQFFTRVPVPGWVGWSPQQAAASSRYLPAVGWLVGAVFGVVLLAGLALWPPTVAVGLALGAALWLTGGFHEDGWADSCDGLGGHASPAQALAIMKDSRVGSYAVLGLLLMLGLKVALWLELVARAPAAAPGVALLAAAVASHSASRLAPLVVMARLDYLRPAPATTDPTSSKSQPLASTRPGAAALAWAGSWALAPLALLPLWGWPGLSVGAAGVAVLLLAGWVTHRLRRRLGGYVGDTLGAAQQLAELGFLLGLAL